MLGHICDIHTETAGSLIDQKHTGLEYCQSILILVIEIMEGHKIAHQSIEITEDMQELVDHIYIGRLLSKSKILGHQTKQSFLSVICQK